MAGQHPEAPEKDQNRINEEYTRGFNRSTLTEKELGRAGVFASSDKAEAARQRLKNSENNPSAFTAGDGVRDQEDVRGREEKGSDAAGYKNNFTGGKASPENNKSGIKGLFKGSRKKGPIAAIVAILIVGFAAVIMLTPGLLVIHVVETITEKMNMQGGSMDVRTAKVYASMMKSTSGFCSNSVSIRCKFRSMNDAQIKRLEDAGIKVILNEGETITGRKKVDALEFKGKRINASSLSMEIKTNVDFRSAARSAYNPWFAGLFHDKVSTKVMSEFGFSLSRIFGPDTQTDELRTEKVKDFTKNGQTTGDPGTKFREIDGQLVDENDKPLEDQAAARAHNDSVDVASGLRDVVGNIDETGEKLTPKVLDAAEQTLRNPTGSIDVRNVATGLMGGVISAPDSACTFYGLYNAVSFGAKTIRSVQMARYAMIFLNTHSAMKAGAEDLTPEDAAYIGNLLTKTVNEKVTDENGETTIRPTKSATDSYGYKYVAYGDTGPLTPSATEFLAGGGLGGKMNGIANSVISILPGSKAASKQGIQETCGVIKNPFVQAGSMIFSVGLLFTGPLGWGALAASLSFGVATDAALEIASSVLTPMITDMVAGVLVDDSTFGEATGDALVSGSGVIMSTLAGRGGNAPLRPSQAVAYVNGTQGEALARYQEEDRLARSPLDPTSPNTLVGAVVSELLPYKSDLSTLSDVATISLSVTSRSFKSIISPFASAAEDTEATYTQCDDEDYRRLGLATDPFCNPIRGIPSQYLEDDPVDIITRLINNKSIDEDSGQPRSDTDNGKRYADFIKNCIDRTDPLGYAGENYDKDDGSSCFIENSKDDKGIITDQMKADWYVYRIDQRVLDGIDNGYDIPDANCLPTTGNGNSSPAAGMADAATIDALIEKSEGGTPGPMHGMGATIIELSNKYGLNSNFIVATFKAETQFGSDGSAGAKYNNFGWNAENGDGDCPSIPLTINGTVRMYNCYSTPEKGIEGALKNITTNPAYKEVPPEAPPGSKEGSVAAVRNVYCPEGDGPAGDPASQCNLERFIEGSIADGIPLNKDDPVFLSSSGTSTPSSSSTPSGGAKISESELKTAMTSYGLPEPQAEGDGGYKALAKKLQDNPDALWAAQELLAGEKNAKSKGMDVKEYLTTAWVWFEGDKSWGPEPYEMNCLNDTEGTEAAYVCPSSSSGDLQVAGYQAADVRDKFQDVYNKLYSESELTSIMKRVIENSSKASKDIWDYNDPSNATSMALLGDVSSITMNDIWPDRAFGDVKGHIASVILGKDPSMVAALNSFAVSEGDVITMLKDCKTLSWSNNSYYCNPALRQEIANMMMALYTVDTGGPSTAGSCLAAAAFTTGKGLGAIVEGNPDPENNFKAEWGNGLYKYGIGHGTNGSEHTGIDIGGERGAAVYTPVSGTVICDKTIEDTGCGAFNSYKVTAPNDPNTPCPYSDSSTPKDGTGHVEIALDNGHTLILGHTLTSVVKVGDRVQAGQQVATVGCMNGHHIHVEYRIPDSTAGYMIVDPEKYLGR